MDKIKRLFVAFCLSALSPAVLNAKTLKVIATTPELVDITKRVGGDLVTVSGIARGSEDIHQVVMRPLFVTKLNQADAVVYLGLTLEHTFLPALLSVAANPKMRADAGATCLGEACIDCSQGLSVLEKPDSLSRAEGEIHPQGNPHYNLDPEDGVLIARNVAAGLSRIDTTHAADYQKNLALYLAELVPKLGEWRKAVAPLKGVKAVSYHKDVVYLGRFTGIDFVETVELKPAVAATPTHLEKLVKLMKEQNIKLIVREQHFEAKTCEWLAAQTGAKVAVIGAMANALPETQTFIQFSEKNLKNLLGAVGKAD